MMLRSCAAAVVVLLWSGCGSVDCEEAPVVTWNNFGQAFVTEHCQTCHASSAPDRYDAPEGVTFDSVEDLQAVADAVLARATGPEADMPPLGGPSEEERYLLETWLVCHEAR